MSVRTQVIDYIEKENYYCWSDEHCTSDTKTSQPLHFVKYSP